MTFYNLYMAFCEMDYNDSFQINIIATDENKFLHYTDWHKIPQELKQKEVLAFSGSCGVWYITLK